MGGGELGGRNRDGGSAFVPSMGGGLPPPIAVLLGDWEGGVREVGGGEVGGGGLWGVGCGRGEVGGGFS